MTTTTEQAKVYRALVLEDEGDGRKEIEVHAEDRTQAHILIDQFFEFEYGWEGYKLEEVRKVDEIDPSQLNYRQILCCDTGLVLYEEEVK